MSKEYGKRLRLSPEEVEIVRQARGIGQGVALDMLKQQRTAQDDYLSQREAELEDVFADDLGSDDELPEGITEAKPPFVLPGKRVLVLSDIHAPYHDVPALKAALSYGRERDIDTIVLNGDVCDFYSVSRWDRDPDRRRLKWELDLTKNLLDKIRGRFPNVQIVYKLGNHDERYDLYIAKRADELYGVEEVAFESLLHLRDYGVECVRDKRIIRAGKLSILHGHEFFGGGGVNVARNARMKANDNVLIGHHHRTQEDLAKRLDGSIYGGWSSGCLCDLSPLYAPRNQWNHGFAFVEIETGGNFRVHNKKVFNGEVL